MDYKPDKKSSRKTTATEIWIFKTKLTIIAVVLAEIMLLILCFNDFYLSIVLVFGLCWLILDLFLINKTKIYTLKEMKFLQLAVTFWGFERYSMFGGVLAYYKF